MGNAEINQFDQDQIQRLYARFKQMDRDGSGDLDPKLSLQRPCPQPKSSGAAGHHHLRLQQ